MAIFPGEYDPEKPEEPLRHEVCATHTVRDEVKALKLKKDDCIEAVLYPHTWEVELQGGENKEKQQGNFSPTPIVIVGE